MLDGACRDFPRGAKTRLADFSGRDCLLRLPQTAITNRNTRQITIIVNEVKMVTISTIADSAYWSCVVVMDAQHIPSSLAHTPQSPLPDLLRSEDWPSSSIAEVDGNSRHQSK